MALGKIMPQTSPKAGIASDPQIGMETTEIEPINYRISIITAHPAPDPFAGNHN